jgi:hypothetical protein
LPGRDIVFVGDSSFVVHELAHAIAGRATFISRLRLDANLFEPPPNVWSLPSLPIAFAVSAKTVHPRRTAGRSRSYQFAARAAKGRYRKFVSGVLGPLSADCRRMVRRA